MSIDFKIKNSIATLVLNNPERLNALNSLVIEEIYNCLQDIEKQANVLVIFGCDKAFAAGVDIKEISELDYQQACETEFINYKWEKILHTKIPTIAAVSGYALGGGFELALACDMIICSEDAKFGFPEVKLGLMPGLGGTQLLTRIVGVKKASEIIMTGNFISANEAKKLHIVNKIVAKELLHNEVNELVANIASQSRLSIRMIKEAINLSQNMGCEQGIKVERNMFRSLFSSTDKKDRVSKFLKK